MRSPLKTYGWHEWLCHTNFSFLLGASHPHDYLKRALSLGYRGIGVTDFDGVYGLARTHLNLRSLSSAARGNTLVKDDKGNSLLKLTHGAEIRLSKDHEMPILLQNTLIIVAQTMQGYANLCRICTYAHREGKHGAYVPLSELLDHPVEGLAAIQPMRGLIRRSSCDPKHLAKTFEDLSDHFGGRFYFAVSRHLNPAEDAWIGPTLALAKKLDKHCLLSQDPFFHEPRQKDLNDLLHAMRMNKTLDEAVAHMFVNSERSLHSLEGIERRFGSLPIYDQALRCSRELADSCDFDMCDLKYGYPKEMIPSDHSAQSYLEHLTWEKSERLYGKDLPEKIQQSLMHELTLIRQLGFADYFLTVWDIVRWARSQGILCQGRGSAANSVVCFMLGITSVDPAQFDLLFERFLSIERGDPPDIDVDFEHERREEVIQYIYRRYGRDKAAMVANVITFCSKGAIRSVGKALGIAESQLSEASDALSLRYFRHSDLSKTIEDLQMDESIPWRLWATLAKRVLGFPRHLGIHSGGFMLADKPLHCFTASEPATMEGRSVVQWCKDDVEGLGFFKIDVLALGMLTALRKGFQTIADHYGENLSLSSIPAGDKPTYQMIQNADTVGTFQIESRAQMSMLPRLKPKEFYDLVVQVAIVRPGPIQGGMVHPYLRRRDRQERISYPDERLKPILERTLGIPIFQEQVMRIAIAVGGFSAGEANELRKHMGSFNIKGDLGPWLSKLSEGMQKNGLKEEFVQGIMGQMRGFADYGFPESHSVSFALLAYASSYMKCHYPAVFFMSVLNSQPMGFYTPYALVQAAQRSGVEILPVCVQKSHWDCSLEKSFASKEPALRLGLRYVNRLSKAGADRLVVKRTALGGSFASLDHMLELISVSRPDLTALATANALMAFGLDRRAAVWMAEASPLCPTLEDVEAPVCWEIEAPIERIEQAFKATSLTLGLHPAAVIRNEHWCYSVGVGDLYNTSSLKSARVGQTVNVFGMVLVRQSPPSAKGMVFLTLEDEHGFLNLVFKPQVYNQYYKLIEHQSFLCVKACVQKQGETHSLLVHHVHEPLTKNAEVIALDSLSEPERDIMKRDLQGVRNYM